MNLAAATQAASGVPTIICQILLIATIIAFILGLAEALGLTSFGARVGGRFTTLVVAIVLLVVYVVLC